jgi:hypothetical protein
MRAQESVRPFDNAAAGTIIFELRGGRYLVAYKGTGSGTVDVKALGPDQATYIACGVTQITATTGQQVVELPPGQYEAVIATFTASYLTLTRIPAE